MLHFRTSTTQMGTGTGALLTKRFQRDMYYGPLTFSQRIILWKEKKNLFPRYFVVIDHTFYGFSGVTTHAGCWENARKACKSGAGGE